MSESTTTIGIPVASAPRAGRGPIPVIGLTGAIGGGKSAAAAILRVRGAAVIDADAVGHEALRRPAIIRRVVDRFGPGVATADGVVDRRALGRIVFADVRARRDLEAIVHPPMLAEFERLIAKAQAGGDARSIVLDAAILLEAGWNRVCDAVVLIDAPRELRLERVARDRGWSDADLAAREAAQWPLDRKKAAADHVVVNDGDARDLEAALDALTAPAAPARPPVP